jgi:hypothetical protein
MVTAERFPKHGWHIVGAPGIRKNGAHDPHRRGDPSKGSPEPTIMSMVQQHFAVIVSVVLEAFCAFRILLFATGDCALICDCDL